MPKTKQKVHARSRAVTKRRVTRGPVHHVKRVLRLTPKFVHGMVVGAMAGVLVVAVLRQVAPVNALTMNVSRDCSGNAVIKCGTLSTTELKEKYSQPGVAGIYSYFGISATDIKNIGSTAAAGVAYKDGTIKLNSTGKVVATDSVSAGREPITGSKRIKANGVTFYVTTSQKAFRANALPVYVVMTNGQFDFAIIPNCSNPMSAKAIAPPKPTPTPTPPPTPSLEPLPEPPPPTPTPSPPVVASEMVSLPATGPSEIAIIGLLAVVGGYIFHVTHRHVRHKRQKHHFN
jgi:hypothetical protein